MYSTSLNDVERANLVLNTFYKKLTVSNVTLFYIVNKIINYSFIMYRNHIQTLNREYALFLRLNSID